VPVAVGVAVGVGVIEPPRTARTYSLSSLPSLMTDALVKSTNHAKRGGVFGVDTSLVADQ